MGRLRAEFLERVEVFADRVLDLCDALDRAKIRPRVVDQLTGSGTSVGANVYEADEALSRADFAKTIGIALKEASETLFWLRMTRRRAWVKPDRVDSLVAEGIEIKKVLGAILSNTRRRPRAS